MKPHNNQSGQLVVEAILLMVAMFSFVLVIANTFKKENFFAQIISAPWQNMSGMIQNGVWAPPGSSMALHPSQHARHRVLRGDDAR